MHNIKTHKIVEDICKLGCNRVNELIEKLERRENIDEVSGLDQNEIDALLCELKAIMAVYQKRS